ncbi:MAG: hypothetical protein ATN35_06650 [Epulopiscium sp. Nele67-Bin004]|nr:MAG: hypothetical protein ATN35_06650 [Epulopiscium sp. Nele67-Bin004]
MLTQEQDEILNKPKTEIIEGVIYLQATPTRLHGIIETEIGYQIRTQINRKHCIVTSDTLEVKSEKHNSKIVPDVALECKNNAKGEYNTKLVVEVWSSSNGKVEREKKKQIYAENKIPYFLEVDYLKHSFCMSKLSEAGEYQTVIDRQVYSAVEQKELENYNENDYILELESPKITINMQEVFDIYFEHNR